MNRIFTTTIAAASLLIGAVGAPTAFAQTNGNAASATISTDGGANSNDGQAMRHRGHHGNRGMQEMKNATPEERAVIKSIMQLERVYMSQGRVNDIKPMLDNVKSKTSNATISTFVDRQLERIANRPTNPDEQIATLTQKLNDDIAKLQ